MVLDSAMWRVEQDQQSLARVPRLASAWPGQFQMILNAQPMGSHVCTCSGPATLM